MNTPYTFVITEGDLILEPRIGPNHLDAEPGQMYELQEVGGQYILRKITGVDLLREAGILWINRWCGLWIIRFQLRLMETYIWTRN